MNDVGGTVGTVALDAISAGSVVETLAVGAVVVELEITGESGGVVVDTGMVLAGTAVVDVVAMLVVVELVVEGNVVVLVEVVEVVVVGASVVVVVVVVAGMGSVNAPATATGIVRLTADESPSCPELFNPQHLIAPVNSTAQV